VTRHESRVLAFAYAGGAPAVIVALWLLFRGDVSDKVAYSAAFVLLGSWLLVPLALRDRIVGPLRTLASVLEAFREGDYSTRSRDHRDDGPLGDAARELNRLGDALRDHRLGALEASALLDRVMKTIDVAVLAVDDDGIVRLANAAAERLAQRRLVGVDAGAAGLDDLLAGEAPRTLTPRLAGARGLMELRRSTFRQGGRAHTLLVLADVGRALRDKEREAWQRLVRVLGHEINSSLAPIQSIADSLATLLATSPRPTDWETDIEAGLAVVSRRAGALSRFLTAYARLAKLPSPALADVEVRGLVERAAALEQRLPVQVVAGPEAVVRADADQIDQVLINLVRNAVEASLETQGAVRIAWEHDGSDIVIHVDDEGPGVSDTSNLFVPFFTTKEGGSGVGLVLARQIAEAHGGTVTLANRDGARGARATLRMHVAEPASPV
jgi:two-component system nitrogen regulation sensor histidine kinase NtrY